MRKITNKRVWGLSRRKIGFGNGTWNKNCNESCILVVFHAVRTDKDPLKPRSRSTFKNWGVDHRSKTRLTVHSIQALYRSAFTVQVTSDTIRSNGRMITVTRYVNFHKFHLAAVWLFLCILKLIVKLHNAFNNLICHGFT